MINESDDVNGKERMKKKMFSKGENFGRREREGFFVGIKTCVVACPNEKRKKSQLILFFKY